MPNCVQHPRHDSMFNRMNRWIVSLQRFAFAALGDTKGFDLRQLVSWGSLRCV